MEKRLNNRFEVGEKLAFVDENNLLLNYGRMAQDFGQQGKGETGDFLLVMGGKNCVYVIAVITGMIDYGNRNITESTLFIDFQEARRFSGKHGS